MGVKALDVYQGNDWTTYRWSAAQVFDTLDQIREVCSLSPGHFPIAPPAPFSGAAEGIKPETPPSMLPTSETFANPSGGESEHPPMGQPESQIEMVGLLLALCDDLSAELTILLADLFPLLQGAASLQWKGFEMRLHLDTLRQQCLPQDRSQTPATGLLEKNALDTIMALAQRMHNLLKQIDQ